MIFRVNTGAAMFKPFAASSIESACEYVRQNQIQNYARPKWLEVLEDGSWQPIVKPAA